MAPALAALAGAGVIALWADYRRPDWRGALLPAALLLTAGWGVYVLSEYPDWRDMLLPGLVGGSLIATGGLTVGRLARATGPAAWRTAQAALAIGLFALLLGPAVWALTPALGRTAGGVPAAGPDLFARPRWGGAIATRGMDVQRLVAFLRAHRREERFLLATANAMQASPIIVQTGEPVMAIGGWGGSDPILTVEQFAGLVVAGQVRYVLLPESDGRGGWGGQLTGGPNAELIRWVETHGRLVDPGLWRAETTPGRGGFGAGRGWRGGMGRAGQLYDCRPPASG